MPVPFIGKEDHPTDWDGAASGNGLLRPPANRTAPIQGLCKFFYLLFIIYFYKFPFYP
jgi:hypothetical protein